MFDETIQKSLIEDHKNLKRLIHDLEKQTEDGANKVGDLKTLFDEFANQLLAHGKSEEKVFYTQLLADSSGENIATKIEEGKQEHHVLELVVNEMKEIELGSKEWKAKLEVLRENLEHHLDEEEKDILQASKKTFDKEENIQLSKDFKEEKSKQLQE